MTGARGGVLGVPTSAGSYNAGQDKAPAAWRSAGPVDQLRARGSDVADYGDLPVTRHRPAEPVAGLRDLERVAPSSTKRRSGWPRSEPMTLARDEIALPVSGHGPILDLGGALGDDDQVVDDPLAAGLAGPLWTVQHPALAQPAEQLLA